MAQFPVFKAEVTNERSYQDMPSASGITRFQGSYYVVGDDSPYLFQLDSEFNIINEIPIFSTKKMEKGRIPKREKPDFECITVVPWGDDNDLLVFGSGDRKEREVMVRIDIDKGKETVETYSLKKFYKHISKKSESYETLNIEGAAYWKRHLVLLNRTDNTLFKVNLDEFKSYMRDNDNDKPKVESIQVKLPSIKGMSARFSGAAVLPDEDILIFTASVENNPNWIIEDDIVCSYLGIIDLNQLENTEPICKLIMKSNQPIKEKVESVFIKEKSATSIKLVGVIDNDDGSSKLIEIDFNKKNK